MLTELDQLRVFCATGLSIVVGCAKLVGFEDSKKTLSKY